MAAALRSDGTKTAPDILIQEIIDAEMSCDNYNWNPSDIVSGLSACKYAVTWCDVDAAHHVQGRGERIVIDVKNAPRGGPSTSGRCKPFESPPVITL